MSVILSFDIGIKNLAYCLFECENIHETKFKIIEWGVLNIHTDDKVFNSKSEKLFATLDSTFSKHLEIINYVVIENQPVLKNPVMKSIQLMLYSYFKLNQIDINSKKEEKQIKNVDLVNASCKVKFAVTQLPKISGFIEPEISDNLAKYKKTKESSIQYTKELLRCLEKDDDLNFFNKFKKKDDLADTLLQGLYYCHKHFT